MVNIPRALQYSFLYIFFYVKLYARVYIQQKSKTNAYVKQKKKNSKSSAVARFSKYKRVLRVLCGVHKAYFFPPFLSLICWRIIVPLVLSSIRQIDGWVFTFVRYKFSIINNIYVLHIFPQYYRIFFLAYSKLWTTGLNWSINRIIFIILTRVI